MSLRILIFDDQFTRQAADLEAPAPVSSDTSKQDAQAVTERHKNFIAEWKKRDPTLDEDSYAEYSEDELHEALDQLVQVEWAYERKVVDLTPQFQKLGGQKKVEVLVGLEPKLSHPAYPLLISDREYGSFNADHAVEIVRDVDPDLVLVDLNFRVAPDQNTHGLQQRNVEGKIKAAWNFLHDIYGKDMQDVLPDFTPFLQYEPQGGAVLGNKLSQSRIPFVYFTEDLWHARQGLIEAFMAETITETELERLGQYARKNPTDGPAYGGERTFINVVKPLRTKSAAKGLEFILHTHQHP